MEKLQGSRMSWASYRQDWVGTLRKHPTEWDEFSKQYARDTSWAVTKRCQRSRGHVRLLRPAELSSWTFSSEQRSPGNVPSWND